MNLRKLSTAFLAIGISLTVGACSGGGSTAKTPKPPGPTPEKPYATTKAPMALPEVSDGSPVSSDRKTMNDLMARAARENKAVVLEVAAAWCGPCMQFAYDLESHPEYLKKLSDDRYILVKTETEKMATLSVNDFVPSFIKFFPSFYQYTPGQGWKMLGSANSYESLAEILKRAKESGPIAVSEFKSLIEVMGNAPQTPAGQTATARLYDSVYTLSANYSYDDAKAIIAILRAESKRFPNLYLENIADEAQQISLLDYLAVGVLSVDELAKDFPNAAADLTDMSRRAFSINQYLTYRLEAIARASGPKAAAAQCEPVSAAARARLTGGSLSQSDMKLRLDRIAKSNTELCAAYELRANGVTQTLRQKAAALDLASLEEWNLLSKLGEKEKALAAYQRRYEMYSGHYTGAIKTTEENMQKAIDQGDTAKAEELKKRLDVLKFQSANHAAVKSDVDEALNTGRALEILKVMN